MEKVSGLILKGKLIFCQLAGIDPAEIVVPFTNAEIASLWAENEHWQRAYSNFGGEINNTYPECKQLQFIKRTSWIISYIIKGMPVSRVLTFYTDANKSGEA